MDAFLKRVVAQREREQEEQLTSVPASVFVRPKCRQCGDFLAGSAARETSSAKLCRKCKEAP